MGTNDEVGQAITEVTAWRTERFARTFEWVSSGKDVAEVEWDADADASGPIPAGESLVLPILDLGSEAPANSSLEAGGESIEVAAKGCLLYTSPSPRD